MSRGLLVFLCFFMVVEDTPAWAKKASWHTKDKNRKACLVMESETNKLLYSENIHKRLVPASITKVMTLYLLFEQLRSRRLTHFSQLKVSANAARQQPTKLGLKVGSSLRVIDAIRGLSLKSANDVAVVVAEAIAGSEPAFALRMTARARALGMRNTTFKNASGLPNKGQYSTAYDLALLAKAVMRDFPQYYKYFTEKKFSYKGRTYPNHNRLLGKEGIDGIKTGYTRSGWNIAISAAQNGVRLIVVVIGGTSKTERNNRALQLVRKGFGLMAPKIARQGLNDMVKIKKKIEAKLPIKNQAVIPALPRVRRNNGPNSWYLQVGAYSTISAAVGAVEKARTLLPVKYKYSRRGIIPIRTSKGMLFRARLFNFCEDDARQCCKIIEDGQLSCRPGQN